MSTPKLQIFEQSSVFTDHDFGCVHWEGTEEHLRESDPSRGPRMQLHDQLTARGLKVGIISYGFPWDVGFHQVNFLENWGERRFFVCWLRLEDDKLMATLTCPKGSDDDQSKAVTLDWVANEYHRLRAEIVKVHGEPDA